MGTGFEARTAPWSAAKYANAEPFTAFSIAARVTRPCTGPILVRNARSSTSTAGGRIRSNTVVRPRTDKLPYVG
jgi:hypothetical protein